MVVPSLPPGPEGPAQARPEMEALSKDALRRAALDARKAFVRTLSDADRARLEQRLAEHLTSLFAGVAVVGGYYVISTFVFPDDPEHWPDFDEYYLQTNRTVLAGMIAINFLTFGFAVYTALGFGLALTAAPVLQSWFSIVAAILFFPCLIILWFVKSRRANLKMLVFMNLLLLFGALGPELI